ncbi:MAG: apolipoprotein N-acyltransferase [Desulfobacterales bacterium RIFOXYA12_FULL_46_15]|nr:MAG: apolipoprotein N-acyltransferase [Desulfobacterales bacterium RIFOXYA12_FULL_46_15]
MLKKKEFLFIQYIPAVASGLLLTLSFPKTGLSYIAFFALIPWLISLPALTLKQSFYSGFIAGLFHFITLIYWIIPTIHIYGGLHLIMAGSTLVLLCFYLALYPAVFAFLSKKLNAPPFFTPILAACLWTSLEYIRTYAFTGFSWGSLGYSQYLNLLFIQIADFSGVYGVSFLIVLINCVFADFFIMLRKKEGKKSVIVMLFTVFLISAVLFYGRQRLSAIDSLMSSAPKPAISVIQGNIEQDMKWSDEFKDKTVDKYILLSKTIIKDEPELIIWPETALPFYYGYERVLSNLVDQCVRESKTHYLIGSPAFKSHGKETLYYNRAYMLNRFSIVTGTYDKNRLVPFGEYVPFGKYLTFLGKITAQAGNFSTGDRSFIPLDFKEHKTGVLICFEILFPEIASGFVKNGADILTAITNDAWFGQTSAPLQHFSMAVFRAVENRRSIARAANTGISGFIDPTGKILETTPLFTDRAITRQIPALTLISFYTRYGDIFAFSAMVAFCLAFMVKGIRHKFRRNKK